MLAIYDDQQVVRNILNHNFFDILKNKILFFIYFYNKFQLTLYHQILQLHLQMQCQVD
jgi:hypothetical protein